LTLAAATQPDALVDVATLTGAAAQAVGCYAAALTGTDDDLVTAVRDGAAAAGERVWPLPLWAELDRFLRSEVADHRQVGDDPHRDPGSDAIMAGLYLQAVRRRRAVGAPGHAGGLAGRAAGDRPPASGPHRLRGAHPAGVAVAVSRVLLVGPRRAPESC
jgi:hypothetical protein